MLRFIGDLSGSVNIVVPFNLTGQAEVLAEGLTFHLDSSMERSASGSAHLTSLSCHTSIKSVDVTNHNGGLFGLAVSVFKQGVSDNVRQLLQGLICKKVRKYIDDDLNEKLAEVQTKSRLNDAIETNAIRSALLPTGTGGGLNLGGLFGENFTKDFFIDFRQRLIKIYLTPSTPGVSSFLRTSCDGAFCISDLVPQLGDYYPNATVDLSLSATRAPAVLFTEKQGGAISINLGAVIILFVSIRNQKKQAAVIDLDVVADAILNLQEHNISGSVHLTKFDLTNRFGAIQISDSELSDISILVSQLMENMINEMLASGFPLPVPHVLKLHNIYVDVLTRRLLIRTDIAVDERSLSKLAAKTLFNGPSFGGNPTWIHSHERTIATVKQLGSQTAQDTPQNDNLHFQGTNILRHQQTTNIG
uniref:BPI2 domain-containing protein n=1 Tax=Heterorhabditis bacteriophora TaxID=37862 RepID=A0A1I7XSF2_HETBA